MRAFVAVTLISSLAVSGGCEGDTDDNCAEGGGCGVEDAGGSAADGGTPGDPPRSPDAGPVGADAGGSVADAVSPGADARPTPDAAAPEPDAVGPGPVDGPSLIIEPEAFVFPTLRPGQGADQAVVVRNVGTEEARIINMRFEDAHAGLNLAWQEEEGGPRYVGLEDGGNVVTPGYWIEPERELTLIVHAVGDEAAGGALVFDSNDPNRPELRISIRTAAPVPELVAGPGTVDFGDVPARDESWYAVVITNIGTGAAHISEVVVDGAPGFRIRMGEEDPRAQPDLLTDPDGDGQPGFPAGGRFEIIPGYIPADEAPAVGALRLLYDGESPELVIPLRANGGR